MLKSRSPPHKRRVKVREESGRLFSIPVTEPAGKPSLREFKICESETIFLSPFTITLIEPKGVNKSPLSPLYKRGGLMLPPLIKGDWGGFCPINVERYLPILYSAYEWFMKDGLWFCKSLVCQRIYGKFTGLFRSIRVTVNSEKNCLAFREKASKE